MKLREFLQQLSYGELSNTKIGSSGSGEIQADKLPVVVNYINEGLLRLYSKFPLRKRILYLELSEWRTDYPLTYEHAYSNEESTEEKYIFDVGHNKFEDDVLKIYDVRTSREVHLPINNSDDPWSVYTPLYNVLQVRRPVGDHVLLVRYWARHPKLTPDDLDAEIMLPEVLEGALRAYVAFQVHSNMNTQEAVVNAQKFQAIYEGIIQDALISDSIGVTESTTGFKFRKNGWV